MLASCGHEHEWSEWQTTKESTCTTNGLRERICECGEKETKSITMSAHSYGEWETTKEATCLVDGSKECVCSVCNYKKTETICLYYSDHSYEYYNFLVTVKEPTCTEDGLGEKTCSYCNEKVTEVISARHYYVDGVCKYCNKGLINIIIPETPITVRDYNSNGSVDETCKITSLTIKKIEKLSYHGTYKIILCWAGEKTYDDDGNNYSSSVGFAYKLYDSEGYVITSDSSFSVGVCVGEKFRDQEETLYDIDLDPNETYTLEILNLD